MKKWIWRGILALIGIVVLVFGGWWLIDHYQYSHNVDQASDVKKWEADPRPLQSQKAATKKLADIKQPGKAQKDLASAAKFVVIPGLRGAWSIDAKTKKAAFGNNWVPQGITQSNSTYFVSLYDGKHKLNSLIVAIDKKTGKYRKSLILKSKAHVGGILYDRARQRLIWSDDTSALGGAGLSYTSQSTIDAYKAQSMQQPIASTRIPLQLANRTSAIALYNNQLVFVKYGKNKATRSIIALPLNAQGLPNAFTLAQFQKLAEPLIPQFKNKSVQAQTTIVFKTMIQQKIINSFNDGWDRLQGIAIADDGLTLLSQSNGAAPGKLWVRVPKDRSWSKLDFDKPEGGDQIVNVPNSVEEISLNASETNLALIFESGARPYREEGNFLHRPNYMDRIIILPISH
ncbi:hypothetical protein FC83_GL002041 [Agrilactobacillus composti DSM 18527 = JCM 14202]|uniref:Uncharacterized protein n=1 Tax=Agrilactobacillus composti DSM 18527 = JCM 14202 TaxID=1423734 RepID=X0PD86_9LACO|nr:hypothetical protein [Agrilactobacillus composti]KRM34901.1 hypothetical protein FC83_GL002041 [Agrilactobacillus composti DSM 18527 = JCM 14202]GAF38778.1 hypothetical protein JCM14202_608 [Agrilactobacillus composti DSM 18527 = JCM 14202]